LQVDHVTYSGPKIATRMLTRNLFAVANLLVQSGYYWTLIRHAASAFQVTTPWRYRNSILILLLLLLFTLGRCILEEFEDMVEKLQRVVCAFFQLVVNEKLHVSCSSNADRKRCSSS